MPRKACVFCGTSDGKSSNEHVFPQWIRDALGLDGLAEAELHSTTGTVKRFQTRPFDQTVNVVCRACNSTWMSALEARARPILTPLFRGEPLRLGPPRQQILAAWTAKTALMVAQMQPNAGLFAPADYRHLFEHGAPTAATLVLLSSQRLTADSRGVRLAQASGRSVTDQVVDPDRQPDDGTSPEHVGVVMFGIGQFVATVLTHTYSRDLNITVVEPRPGLHRFDDHHLQVWPTTRPRLRWPPRDLTEVGGFTGMFKAWTDLTD